MGGVCIFAFFTSSPPLRWRLLAAASRNICLNHQIRQLIIQCIQCDLLQYTFWGGHWINDTWWKWRQFNGLSWEAMGNNSFFNWMNDFFERIKLVFKRYSMFEWIIQIYSPWLFVGQAFVPWQVVQITYLSISSAPLTIASGWSTRLSRLST